MNYAVPKNQGRVRVQMLWQKTKHLLGPWVRVMTPDAGSSSEVSKNRGMVFIPEIGDHVMLGFHHHNPNKPLVLGSLFNGTTGAGGQEKNHLKSIFTRGGSTITFNELDNSILIKDPSGNTWFMDGKGNIKVTAPKNMTISVGDNLDITVGKDMSLSVGNDKTSTIGNNNKLDIGNNNSTTIAALYKLVTNMYNEKVNEDKKVDITGNLVETTATTTHKAVGGDILIKSAGIAKVLGAVDAKVNKG